MIPIITVSSHKPAQDYYCYDDFFRICKKYGCSPVVLGQNGTYKGLISKPKLLLSYLLQNNLNAEHMIFADCWDIVFTSTPTNIMDQYSKFNTDIVFNAERNLFPRADLADQYPDVGTPYKYLNSGFFIGKVKSIITMLESMNLSQIPDDHMMPNGQWHHENDQGYFLEMFPKQPVPMKLDSNCEIAQTLHAEDIKDFELTPQGWKNKITGTYPMVWHANGGGKTGNVFPQVLKLVRTK